MIPYWSPPLPESRLLLGINLVLLVGPLVAWRFLYARMLTRPSFRVTALVLGQDETATEVARLLLSSPEPDYDLVIEEARKTIGASGPSV